MQGGAGPSKRCQAAEHPSWKSLSMVSGPLDTALVVRVQPVCTHTHSAVLSSVLGIMFSERPAGGVRGRSVGPCSDEIVLVV